MKIHKNSSLSNLYVVYYIGKRTVFLVEPYFLSKWCTLITLDPVVNGTSIVSFKENYLSVISPGLFDKVKNYFKRDIKIHFG